jgi:hypothetical protein
MIELILWNKKVFSLANPMAAKILREGGQGGLGCQQDELLSWEIDREALTEESSTIKRGRTKVSIIPDKAMRHHHLRQLT